MYEVGTGDTVTPTSNEQNIYRSFWQFLEIPDKSAQLCTSKLKVVEYSYVGKVPQNFLFRKTKFTLNKQSLNIQVFTKLSETAFKSLCGQSKFGT